MPWSCHYYMDYQDMWIRPHNWNLPRTLYHHRHIIWTTRSITHYADVFFDCNTFWRYHSSYDPGMHLEIVPLFVFTWHPIQAIFTGRIYMFSGSLYLPVICWLMSAYVFLGTIVIAAETLRLKSLEDFEVQYAWLITSVFIVTACVDVIIAASMCYLLQRQRSAALRRWYSLNLHCSTFASAANFA